MRVQKLEDAWGKFSTGTNERANRLTVAAMFIGQSDKVMTGPWHQIRGYSSDFSLHAG